MDDTSNLARTRRRKAEPELSPSGTPLHIAAAPGLLDVKHTIIREPGESDERYQSRCDLLAALLDHAKQG